MTSDGPIAEDNLQAYVDGRLADEQRAAVEAYLAQNPDVRERVALDTRQRNALRGQLEAKFAEPVPPRLWIANIRAARRTAMVGRLKAIAASLVIFTVGASAGWFAAHHETLAPPATSAPPPHAPPATSAPPPRRHRECSLPPCAAASPYPRRHSPRGRCPGSWDRRPWPP